MSTRAQLEAQLAEVEAKRSQLDAVAAYLRERIAATPGQTNGGGRKRQGVLTAATAAEQVLREHGQMRTPDLLVKVQEAGAQMKDADSLYKTLSRSKRFRRAGRGLWELAEGSQQ